MRSLQAAGVLRAGKLPSDVPGDAAVDQLEYDEAEVRGDCCTSESAPSMSEAAPSTSNSDEGGRKTTDFPTRDVTTC